MRDRPSIRVNQLGYLPGQPMQATLVCDDEQPVEFVVRDQSGVAVFAGRSQPWPVCPEPTSGLCVHVVDFTGVRSGGHLRIEALGWHSHSFAVSSDLYRRLRADALRVFYLLRSGTPIIDHIEPGYSRPAGHLGFPPNRGDVDVPAWTGPEAEELYPGWHCAGTFDVSGGWYDAGDYGKYVTSGAIAVWQLLSTLEVLEPSAVSGVSSGEFRSAVEEECRWQLDWLLRMQVPQGDPLAGMVFHRVHGAEWSPMPGWAHEDPTPRVLHRPSTSATLHLAAVAAQAARLFGAVDGRYAERLLRASRLAYESACGCPTLLAPDDHARFGGGPYGDTDPTDDFYWAAAELWLATGEDRYRNEVMRSALHEVDVFESAGFDFDRVGGPARLDLALSDAHLPDHDRVCTTVEHGARRLLALQAQQPWGQPYAPDEGWDWGSNGRILNNLVVLAAAHRLTGEPRYRDGVVSGMDYLLGRNALGQSYITGYGSDFTCHQRTRQFGHDLDPALPPPPSGALAGGPNSRPHPDFPYDARLIGLAPQCCYLDEPTSEVTNDICIRWNAPLVFVATYLQAFSIDR